MILYVCVCGCVCKMDKLCLLFPTEKTTHLTVNNNDGDDDDGGGDDDEFNNPLAEKDYVNVISRYIG